MRSFEYAMDFWHMPWEDKVVLRGGVNVLPRASIDHEGASSSSNSIGVGPDNLAVLDIDEDRPAVGAVGVARDTIAHVGSAFPGQSVPYRPAGT